MKTYNVTALAISDIAFEPSNLLEASELQANLKFIKKVMKLKRKAVDVLKACARAPIESDMDCNHQATLHAAGLVQSVFINSNAHAHLWPYARLIGLTYKGTQALLVIDAIEKFKPGSEV